MAHAVVVILSMALGIGIPASLIRSDMRRLDPGRLERAWPEASFWSAVVAFGPLCIPIHFWKTRRSWLGLLIGLVWCSAAFLALGAATALVESALE